MNDLIFYLCLVIVLILILLTGLYIWGMQERLQRHSRRLTKLETELNSVPQSLELAHEYIRPLQQDTVRLWKQVHDLTEIQFKLIHHAKRRSRSPRSR